MKKILILILIIFCGTAFIVTSAAATKPVTDQEVLIYQIIDAKMVNTGELVELPEGVWKKGITLEARAKIKKGSMFPEGRFVLTYDAFSPNQDMGTQKAGMWYVVGRWTVTKNGADPEEVKIKHNPSVTSGDILGELAFDPSAAGPGWTAKAIMRMGLAAGRWSSGEGSFTLNSKGEGDLFLDLTRWPELGQ